MLKTFIFGIVLGIAAVAGALYALPVIDQHREPSLVSVAANGGNVETFHINVPMDRILLGAPRQATSLPASMVWPDDEVSRDVRVELFKLRDARDTVVGVASRAASKNGETDVIEWVVHLPARGSIFVKMNPEERNGGYRRGKLWAGSREFEPFQGFVTEQWLVDSSGEEDAPDGRIELKATYVGELEPTE